MKRNRRRLAALLALLLMVGLVTIPIGLTWREVRQERLQERLNDALLIAVIQNDVNSVRSLLQQGASPNASCRYASNHRSIWQYLLDTVLHRPVPLNTVGDSALTLAIDHRYSDSYSAVAIALLDAGANPNLKDAGIGTPLNGAIAWHQWKTMQALLRHHVDVNLRDNRGATPLRVAAAKTDPDMVEALLHQGAVIDEKDDYGHTALWTAVSMGPLVLATDVNVSDESIRATVACLLRHGASVKGRDRTGMTILQWAQRCSHDPQLIQMLKQAGAKE